MPTKAGIKLNRDLPLLGRLVFRDVETNYRRLIASLEDGEHIFGLYRMPESEAEKSSEFMGHEVEREIAHFLGSIHVHHRRSSAKRDLAGLVRGKRKWKFLGYYAIRRDAYYEEDDL